MGTFNAAAFRDKLGSLNSTQASIETLSNWCQFFRKSAPAVVAAWDAEYMRAPPPRRLLMLYLANDILQNSRRKGPEFVVEFYKAVPRSLRRSLRDFDDGTRARVNRLISVWDERKVFGHTGTRTLKELLAEAETPTKRGLSARTGGPSAADDPFGGPPTPNGAAGGSGIARELQPLADAFATAAAADAASRALVDSCSAVLQRGLLETGPAEEVQQAADLLRDYQGALAHESQALGAALAALRLLLVNQEEAAQRVAEQEALASRQLQACRTRLAALIGAPQPPVSSAGAPPVPGGSNALPTPASNAAIAAPPPLPAAVAPPLPAMSGPGGVTPPPLPVSLAGGSAPPEQLPLTTSAAAPGGAWQQPLLGQQEAGSSPAPLPPPDVDMLVDPPPEQPPPPLPGQFGGGDDDEAAAAAAALVAQLSAANDSKALLEALAALPQDQQREISLSFLSSGAAAGLASAGAGGGGGDPGEEEEYNPEDPGF